MSTDLRGRCTGPIIGPVQRNRARRHLLAAALTVLALALTGCAGQSESASGTDDAPAEAGDATEAPGAEGSDGEAALVVTVQGFRFDPPATDVAAGQMLEWRNEDGVRHTATSGTPGDPDGRFEVDLPDAGTSGGVTFEEAGTYPYFCAIHTSMTGEVTVTG